MTLGGSEAVSDPRGRGDARDPALRLARLHLRSGAHALARAELEARAGADRLDRDAVADLAEVRWRTGDLAGARAAALAWLEDGEGEPRAAALVHVICAEAAATAGRDDEAAHHVDAAAAHLADPSALGALLAGIRPRAAWPGAAGAGTTTDAGAPGAASPAGIAAAAAGMDAAAPPAAPASVPPPGPTAGAIPVAPAAADLAAAGSRLLATAPERAAVLLALALRADRAAAAAVLGALDAAGPATSTVAALAFVRAEALRAAGRHEEARIAYASAERLALAPAEAGTPRSIP